MSRTRTRTRINPGGIAGTDQTGPRSISSVASTSTCVDETHPGPPFRSGGPLLITKVDYFREWSKWVHSHPQFTTNFYEGRLVASLPTPSPRSPTNLSGWGALGWYRALPVRDITGIARFLGELREAPRMLEGLQRWFSQFITHNWKHMKPRDWADAWLNQEFGWKPFITDLYNILTLPNRVEDALRKLEKNNDKPLHRRFVMLDEQYSTNLGVTRLQSGGTGPVLSSFCYGSASDPRSEYVDRLDVSREISFEGVFLYHLKKAAFSDLYEDLGSRADLIAKLSGLIPDMRVLYQLTPWSWLLDWFTSAGAIVANATLMAKYHQVAKYAYVMCHEKYTTKRMCSVIVKQSSSNAVPSVSSWIVLNSRVEQEYKQRVAASPYGFGLTWSGFSPYQLSILTSLGVKRT